MGFCAKVNLLSVFISVFIILSFIATEENAASINAKSWPFMKTYDIWGTDDKSSSEEQSRKKRQQQQTVQTKNQNMLLSNDNILLQDYSYKTSLRDGKGKEISMIMLYNKNEPFIVCLHISLLC